MRRFGQLLDRKRTSGTMIGSSRSAEQSDHPCLLGRQERDDEARRRAVEEILMFAPYDVKLPLIIAVSDTE
jgi:hypothetical protein